MGSTCSSECRLNANKLYFFFGFPNLFAIYIDTFKYNQQMVCWKARAGRGVLVAPLRDKRVKSLCGCYKLYSDKYIYQNILVNFLHGYTISQERFTIQTGLVK
jgi:hypothetical protein